MRYTTDYDMIILATLLTLEVPLSLLLLLLLLLFLTFSVFVANPKNYFTRWPIPLVVC